MHDISPFPVFFVFKLFAFLAFVEEGRAPPQFAVHFDAVDLQTTGQPAAVLAV